MLMGVKGIQEIMPHKHPLLLVDCIEELESGVCAAGYKCVAYNESSFKGYFPQESVIPGVLLTEALIRTGAAAIPFQERFRGRVTCFGGIKKVKFRRKVVPGDKIKLECEIIGQRGLAGVGKATATVDGKLAVSVELTFMIG